MDVATYHNINPETGMIETTGNYACAFDSEKKKAFLELYKKNGLAFYRTCKELSVGHSTINHHYEIDPQFKLEFDQAEKEYADELLTVSRRNALEPKMVIERIFHLKSLFPGKYSDGQKPQGNQITINVNGDLLIDAKKRIESMTRQLDQDVIDVSANMSQTVQNEGQ